MAKILQFSSKRCTAKPTDETLALLLEDLKSARAVCGGDGSRDEICAGRIADAIAELIKADQPFDFTTKLTESEGPALAERIQEWHDGLMYRTLDVVRHAMTSIILELTGGDVPPGLPFHGPKAL